MNYSSGPNFWERWGGSVVIALLLGLLLTVCGYFK
jgi:hypothetical protein